MPGAMPTEGGVGRFSAATRSVAGLDRAVGLHREHDILREQLRDGRDVALAQIANAQKLVGQQGRPADGEDNARRRSCG